MFSKLKKGEVLSEIQFYIVDEVKGNKARLLTDNGEPVVVDSKYVDTLLTSADQFEKEEKVTKTALEEILMNNPRTAVTVNYNKQVKEEDVVKEIETVYSTTAPKDISKKIKEAVSKSMNGVPRTIVGRHYGSKDAGGRIQFIDMNEKKDPSKAYDTRLRLVDTRTLNWAIVDKVKYVVK